MRSINLPSIKYLITRMLKALSLHPLVILSAVVAVIFGIYLVEQEPENVFPFVNFLLCGYLGVPLFLSVDIYASVLKNKKIKWAGSILGLVLLLGVYHYLPGTDAATNISVAYIRYTILAVAAHLLVSFVPFIQSGTLNGFWQYNKQLFLRFLLAVLYSGFFFVGIVLALLALQELFQVDVPEKLYFQLFITIAGVFNTWFFVAEIPQDFKRLDKDETYPIGLRVFILYVLIPLLGLYFLILYSYFIKIILLWDWPSGIITYMIIAVAVLGILAMLLAYPFSIREASGPIRFLKRGYYWVLIPIIMVLYLAIGIRVAEYGVTINRYITILLAVWLTGISIYMAFGGKDIRLIPMSLFMIILLCSFGPWGVFRVSERSQVARLESILREADILQEKIKNEAVWKRLDAANSVFENPEMNEGILSDSLHNEVISILDYLEQFHGLRAIDDWMNQDIRSVADDMNVTQDVAAIQLMGLKSGMKYGALERIVEFPSFTLKGHGTILPTGDFDYFVGLDYGRYGKWNESSSIISEGIQVVFDGHTLEIIAQADTVNLDVMAFYDQLKKMQGSPDEYNSLLAREPMTLIQENEKTNIKLVITNIQSSAYGISSLKGYLMVDYSDQN